jgi:hypothetical protein
MKLNIAKTMRILSVSVLIVSISGIAPRTLSSQVGRGKEQLKGEVVNEEGKPIEGAGVVILFKGHYLMDMKTRKVEFVPVSAGNMEIRFDTKTDKNGKFRFIGLGYGQWELTAAYGELEPAYEIVVMQSGLRSKPIKLQMFKKAPPSASSPTGAPAGINLGEEIDEESKKILKNPKKLYELGEQLLANDELENAIRCFYLVIQQKSDWSAPYLKLGYAYFNLGNDQKALEYFKKFLELDPKSPEALTVKEIVEILKEE